MPYYPVPPNGLISHVGPITRTVADAALMLQAMAGPDDRDMTSLEAPPEDFIAGLDGGIAGLRVGFSPDLGYLRVDAEVAEPVLRAAAAFLGNRFITSSPPTGSRSSARARRMSSQSSRRVIFAMSACLPPRLSGCRSLLRSSNPRAALFTQLDSLGHADLESGESGIRVSYAPSSPRSSGLWASSGAPRSNIAAM